MIKSVTITNYLGDVITMSLREPNKTGFLISSIDGLGPVKANINTTEMATRDGSLYASAHANERNITMTIVFVDSDQQETIEGLRHKTYKYFPLKKNLTMEIETDNRTLQTVGYVESNEPEIFSSQEGTQISIICPDPYFYSCGDSETTRTSFNGVTSLFEFQFSNESLTEPEIEFGQLNEATSAVVNYSGDNEIGVTFYLHFLDDAGDITIYSYRTRGYITIYDNLVSSITGHSFKAADRVTICTVKGKKSAKLLRDGVTYNLLNALDKDSEWFSLAKGDNVFEFSAASGVVNVQLIMENETAYEGV